VNSDTYDFYALALGTGDRYTAMLAARLNEAVERMEQDPEPEFLVEEPDF
jgi:hypothetical protein